MAKNKEKTMKIPYIASAWKVLFKPEEYGNYINDHSVVKGADGKWHLFGITSFGGGPGKERYFAHGVGENLSNPMKERGKAIDRGGLAWAPCVIQKDDNFYMFYGPSPTQLSVSFDMCEWFNYPVVLKGEPLMAAHRDHFVLEISKNKYLMYVVGVHEKKGAVSIFSSSNLLKWKFEGLALQSGENAPLNPAWGAMESPFVVKKDGLYYLFVTYTDCSKENYNDTLVFVSKNPKNFGIYNGEKDGVQPITKIQAHAPEILKENGEYYITTCGWDWQDIPHPGAVSIARLEWR